MKIHREQTEVMTSGIGEAKQFGFKLTPETYAMFFKNIYKNPILAIVRELSCNARDAHKMAGQTRPFTIKVPTRWEPNFEIRDYGTGLSKEQMETLYTTFFESSKQASNDFIGGLGIGSKSPLAYTDSFTVTSYHDGKEIVYIIGKDELDVPTWNFVSISDTSEPNGLLINVPVIASNSADIAAFEQAIIRTFAYFDTPVEILGGNVTITVPDYKFIQDGQYGFRNNNPINETGLFAIMGSIPYPIDIQALRLDQATFAKYRGILFDGTSQRDQQNVDLFFDIGSLSITPSREELQYDKRTVDAILKRFEKVTESFLQEMTIKINSAATYFQACKFASELNYSQQRLLDAHSVTYGGKPLNYRHFKIESSNIPFHTVQSVDPLTQTNVTTKVPNLIVGNFNAYNFERNAVNGKAAAFPTRLESSYDLDFNYQRYNPVFVVKDIRCSNVIPRFMTLFADYNIKPGTNVDYMYSIQPHHTLTTRQDIDAAINAWFAANGIVRDVDMKVVYLSDCAEMQQYVKARAPRGSSSAGKKYDVNCYDLTAMPDKMSLYDMLNNKLKGSYVTENIDTFKDTGKYYVRDSALGCVSKINGTPATAEVLHPLYRVMGIEKIYAVPLQRMNKNIEANWTELNTAWFENNLGTIMRHYLLLNKKNNLPLSLGMRAVYNKYDTCLLRFKACADAAGFQSSVLIDVQDWFKTIKVSDNKLVDKLMDNITRNQKAVDYLNKKGIVVGATGEATL